VLEVETGCVPRFLFWNIHGRDLYPLVARLARERSVDIIVLAESKTSVGVALETLNQPEVAYQFCKGFCESISIFANFQPAFIRPVWESARVSIRRLALPARDDILLAAAHLPSKMHFSDDSLVFECASFAEMIAEQEKLVGHKRTIVLGDLNVNPFEIGMVGTGGLHAVMSRTVAQRNRRTVQAASYDFFYNPMWSHFGDSSSGPPGTYFYEKAEHVVYFWNIFDQVLVRPELLGGFDGSSVQVVHSIGDVSLLGEDGIPDMTVGSDHLPIVVELDF
jgi:endonuclease/exonuclease/phosphatase family metal-dependent hydrolase